MKETMQADTETVAERSRLLDREMRGREREREK